MTAWARLAILLLAALLTGCSEYADARRAYERGDYQEAQKRLKALADQGHADAKFDLAHMYFSGIGVPVEPARAWDYLVSSAHAGNTGAMVELAMRYASGIGTRQSLIMAARWYREAAHRGSSLAAFNLASMHEVGTEVAKDPLLAYAWYEVSRRKGNKAAGERADELRSKMLRAEVERGDALVEKLLSQSGS